MRGRFSVRIDGAPWKVRRHCCGRTLKRHKWRAPPAGGPAVTDALLSVQRGPAVPPRRSICRANPAARPHRLQMVVFAAGHDQRLVTAGKEVSARLVADVEALGVNPEQPLHPRHRLAWRV